MNPCVNPGSPMPSPGPHPLVIVIVVITTGLILWPDRLTGLTDVVQALTVLMVTVALVYALGAGFRAQFRLVAIARLVMDAKTLRLLSDSDVLTAPITTKPGPKRDKKGGSGTASTHKKGGTVGPRSLRVTRPLVEVRSHHQRLVSSHPTGAPPGG